MGSRRAIKLLEEDDMQKMGREGSGVRREDLRTQESGVLQMGCSVTMGGGRKASSCIAE